MLPPVRWNLEWRRSSVSGTDSVGARAVALYVVATVGVGAAGEVVENAARIGQADDGSAFATKELISRFFRA
jgi:hypothetical protein